MSARTAELPDWSKVPCPHCGHYHPGACPRVRKVVFYPDGRVRSVEYHPPEVYDDAPDAGVTSWVDVGGDDPDDDHLSPSRN